MKNPQTIHIPEWHRAVIKVGSSLLSQDGKLSTKYILPLVTFIQAAQQQNKEIILVSSGAVACGLRVKPDKLNRSDLSIPEKQAFSAIGQPLLMDFWNRFFDIPTAQILLTLDDIQNRRRYLNIKNVISELLSLHVLPIINENDSVAVHELKFGDNDNLAAHIASVGMADLLILSTDIDGLYTANPHNDKNATHIPIVEKVDDYIFSIAGDSSNPRGSGGMHTKIQAAEKATAEGINVLMFNGKKSRNYLNLLTGSVQGTLFQASPQPVSARKNWLSHAGNTHGSVTVDAGAARAILKSKSSLLPSGIIGIDGQFDSGAVISIIFNGEKIAKGFSQYPSSDIQKIKGKKSHEIRSILGYITRNAVIHRDDLVILK